MPRLFASKGEPMTVSQVIDYVNHAYPHARSNGELCRWLSELDGKIASEIMMMSPEDCETFKYKPSRRTDELLVRFPYDDIYRLYVIAMIEQANMEWNKYLNSVQSFNSRLQEFEFWFCSQYEPVQGYTENTGEEEDY